MNFLTITLFFAYTYGLGFSVAKIAKESENFLERNLMRTGIGLGAVIVLGLFLNIARMPIDWRIFLAASMAFPLFYLLKNFKSIIGSFRLNFKITKYDMAILAMLLIFLASFYMYAKGAFSYPWLEDDDSWGHAIGVKYAAVEKKVFAENPLRYLDPYPPSYDMLLGILHQTNNSVYWTLKFFNALIISLGIIFFFFFAKELTGKNKALFAAFALASIPAFLSHFIWAIALSIPLYFVSFYCTERIKYDKKWIIAAAVMIGAALTISPSHSAYFAAFFAIYSIAKSIADRKMLVYLPAAGFIGILISLALWWIPVMAKHGLAETLKGLGSPPGVNVLTTAGTADRMYALSDFLIAQKENMINNPIGIGLVIFALAMFAVLSIIWKYHAEIKKNKLLIFGLFFASASAMLFFLSHTYTKYVPKRNVAALAPGSVPFFELLSDQFFMIASLSIILFAVISLAVINYKNSEFKDGHLIIALGWLFFAFYAVNASAFYYKITPFRAWSVLAIPVAILASEGMAALIQLFGKPRIAKFAVITLAVAGVLFTSAYQKYAVNTAQWPPGGFWTSSNEIMGYTWAKDNLPKNSMAFTFVNDGPVIGMDMYTCHWCSSVQDYKAKGFNETALQNYNWLKMEQYKYLIIDGQTARKFGANETNTKINSLIGTGKFKIDFSNNGMVILSVV